MSILMSLCSLMRFLMIVMLLGGECYCRNRMVEIGRNVSSSFLFDVPSKNSLSGLEVLCNFKTNKSNAILFCRRLLESSMMSLSRNGTSGSRDHPIYPDPAR